MPALILDQTNRHDVLSPDSQDGWIVACLCADWCDVCKQYQPAFHRLADNHPDAQFLWIDVEDHADLIGDLDVENFPTLLIQKGDDIRFFGTVVPDMHVAERLIGSCRENDTDQVGGSLSSHAQNTCLQPERNLRNMLRQPGS